MSPICVPPARRSSSGARAVFAQTLIGLDLRLKPAPECDVLRIFKSQNFQAQVRVPGEVHLWRSREHALLD
jgi:hypothetical protein